MISPGEAPSASRLSGWACRRVSKFACGASTAPASLSYNGFETACLLQPVWRPTAGRPKCGDMDSRWRCKAAVEQRGTLRARLCRMRHGFPEPWALLVAKSGSLAVMFQRGRLRSCAFRRPRTHSPTSSRLLAFLRPVKLCKQIPRGSPTAPCSSYAIDKDLSRALQAGLRRRSCRYPAQQACDLCTKWSGQV